MRIVHGEGSFIDYRLNLLGIRASASWCQLIAKSFGEWSGIGPRWDLPITIPGSPDELKVAAVDTLRLTAYQYDMERPGSDLSLVLALQKDFQTAVSEVGGTVTAGKA
jgi:hypothetical protein